MLVFFELTFLLRPTAKLFAFLLACIDLHHCFATGFFTRCFPSGCAVFKVQDSQFFLSFRSLVSALLSLCFRSLPLLSLSSRLYSFSFESVFQFSVSRSLKTIQCQEEDSHSTGVTPDFFGFSPFLRTCVRPTFRFLRSASLSLGFPLLRYSVSTWYQARLFPNSLAP